MGEKAKEVVLQSHDTLDKVVIAYRHQRDTAFGGSANQYVEDFDPENVTLTTVLDRALDFRGKEQLVSMFLSYHTHDYILVSVVRRNQQVAVRSV